MKELSAASNKPFLKNRAGVAALEYAILLPVVLVLAFGIFEIGIYLVREQVVARAVGTTARSIQTNPTDGSLQSLAYASGGTLVPLSPGNAQGNYICARSYLTAAAAAAGCTGGWNTSPPSGITGNTYYVAVWAVAPYRPVTPLVNFMQGFLLRDIVQSAVIQVGGSPGGPPKCVARPAGSAVKIACGLASTANCRSGEFAMTGGLMGGSNGALQNSTPVLNSAGLPVGWSITMYDVNGSGSCSSNNYTAPGAQANGTAPGFPAAGGAIAGQAYALCCHY